MKLTTWYKCKLLMGTMGMAVVTLVLIGSTVLGLRQIFLFIRNSPIGIWLGLGLLLAVICIVEAIWITLESDRKWYQTYRWDEERGRWVRL